MATSAPTSRDVHHSVNVDGPYTYLRTTVQNTCADSHFVNKPVPVAAVLMSVIVVAISFLVCLRRIRISKQENRPPGSLGLPLLGDDSFINAYFHNTLKAWHDLKHKQYGPIFKAQAMGRACVFLDAPAGIKLLLSTRGDEDNLKGFWPPSFKEIKGAHSSSSKQGTEYLKHRNYLMRNFLGKDVMSKYVEVMDRAAKQHVQEHWMCLDDGSVVKAMDILGSFTLSFISELCMGMTDPAQLKKFKSLTPVLSAGMYAKPVRLPGFTFYKALKAKEKVFDLVRANVAIRREDLKEGRATTDQDLLSVLISQPHLDGQFHSDDEIVDSMVEMVRGGHETTSSTITTVLRNLSQHPEVYEKLIQEHAMIASRKDEGQPLTAEDLRSMEYTNCVITESLRLTPTLQTISREAIKDFKYNDFNIYKGDVLVITAANSHWNEEMFKDWQKFDPSRFEKSSLGGAPPFSFFPWGGGHRLCPGKEFARQNMLTFLHHFLRNIKWTVIVPDEKVNYSLLPTPLHGTPIKVTKVQAF